MKIDAVGLELKCVNHKWKDGDVYDFMPFRI